jgi:hypothetical protein
MGVFIARRAEKKARAPAVTIEDLINALVAYLPSVADYRHSTFRIDCDRFYKNTTIDLFGQFDAKLNRRVWVRVTIDDKAETNFSTELWADQFVVRVDSKDLDLELALVIEPQADRSIEIFKILRWENGEAIFNRIARRIRCAIVKGDRRFEFPIVGELDYQQELERLAGGRRSEGVRRLAAALLVPERDSVGEKYAVAVKIEKRTVGYLSSDIAPIFLKALADSGFDRAAVGAAIVGGWLHGGEDAARFNVKLDIALPFNLVDGTLEAAAADEPEQ